MNGEAKPISVEQYIAAAPEALQPMLQQIRAIIRTAAPNAVETISYGMPAYKGRRVLVYFAAQKKHLGFYPTASGIAQFAHELKDYKTSKGAVQFPYDRPLPEALIAAIVQFRAEEDRL